MDTDRALTASRAADFPGLRTNADPHDLKPGESTVQVNCTGSTRGTLKTRYGVKKAAFDNGDTNQNPIFVCMPMQTPLGSVIVYQEQNGKICYGTYPS